MLEIGLIVAAIFVLLVISGLFSGSETALTAASRPRMHQLEQEDDERAKTVNKLLEKPERLIGSILIGNNLVNILASALTTALFIELFGGTGVFFATIVMTVLVVIFSEVLPKTYAINNAEKAALFIARIMRPIVMILSPFSALVVGIANTILNLAGIKTDKGSVYSAREEIRSTIDLHHKEESLVKEDKDMLSGLLDLDDLEISDLMVHRTQMVSLNADDSPKLILDAALKSKFSRLPIWRDNPDNIIGIVHFKDVLQSLAKNRFDVDKLDIPALAKDAWFVPETRSAQDQLHAFLSKNAHFALIVDEYGAVEGLVTLEDILEEIVGEISDEHDETAIGIRPQHDGSINIDGDITIREINRHFDWNLPEDGPTTIAGLVIETARMIPEPGEIFQFFGFRFQVLRKKHNRLTAVRVTPIDSTNTPKTDNHNKSEEETGGNPGSQNDNSLKVSAE